MSVLPAPLARPARGSAPAPHQVDAVECDDIGETLVIPRAPDCEGLCP